MSINKNIEKLCTSVNVTDCRGNCPSVNSTYYVTDCTNSCVPIGDKSTYDVCGICGGNGKSCFDCSGVVNGTAKFDACGVCQANGSSCGFIYQTMSSVVIPNTENAVISIFGAGFSQPSSTVYSKSSSICSPTRACNGLLRPLI